MKRTRQRPPLDARSAEEIAAAVSHATKPRVGDIIANPDREDGGEVLIVMVSAKGWQAIPLNVAMLAVGALEVRRARR